MFGGEKLAMDRRMEQIVDLICQGLTLEQAEAQVRMQEVEG